MNKIALCGINTFCVFFMCGILTSCTLSFQNISTHGTATDLVDEEQDADPTVSPNINIPSLT